MASNTTEEKGEGINRWKTATIEFCSETTAHGFCNLNRFGRSKVGTEIGSITVNMCTALGEGVLLWTYVLDSRDEIYVRDSSLWNMALIGGNELHDL